MRTVFGRNKTSSETKESEDISEVRLNLDHAAQQEQINKTNCLNIINASTVKKHNRNITKFFNWLELEVQKIPISFKVT